MITGVVSVGAMDTFARGLRNAVKILDDGLLPGAVKVIKAINLDNKINQLPSYSICQVLSVVFMCVCSLRVTDYHVCEKA